MLLFALWAFISCKKDIGAPSVVPNLGIEQMLQLPIDTSHALQSTTNNLRTQLQQQDFSGKFLRLHGQPLWNKAIQKGKAADNYVLYVPTQLPGQNKVASFFTARYRNGKFTYRLYPSSAIASGLHGLQNWQLAYWFARMEARVFGKRNIQVAWVKPTAYVSSGHRFGLINPVSRAGGSTETTGLASGSGFEVQGEGDDCCIEIWENPDGDPGNDNGDEYYLHDDCSACADEEGEIEDELVDGAGGCPWYNPLCNVVTGGGTTGLNPTVNFLVNTLQLNTLQTDWLMQTPDIANAIAQALDDSKADMNPLTGLPYGDYTPAAISTSQATLAAAMANYIYAPCDMGHWQVIAPYMQPPNNVIDPVLFWNLFKVYCALKKIEHPEWSKARIYWEALSEAKHEILDGLGMIPLIGEVADLANGILYTIEGDGVNASLSYAAMIPFAGWFASGAKLAKKTIMTAAGNKTTLKWWVKADNVTTYIDFGDKGQLRKALGLVTGDPRQAHHIIPFEESMHPAVQKAAKGGNTFHMNDPSNGIPLSTAVHNGSHPAYTNRVKARLNAIDMTQSSDVVKQKIDAIIFDIREAIRLNPGTPIQQLIF